MNEYPFSEASLQLFQTTMAVSWEEVCAASNYAQEYVVFELFLN